mgnify:CR=1 FL=1
MRLIKDIVLVFLFAAWCIKRSEVGRQLTVSFKLPISKLCHICHPWNFHSINWPPLETSSCYIYTSKPPTSTRAFISTSLTFDTALKIHFNFSATCNCYWSKIAFWWGVMSLVNCEFFRKFMFLRMMNLKSRIWIIIIFWVFFLFYIFYMCVCVCVCVCSMEIVCRTHFDFIL